MKDQEVVLDYPNVRISRGPLSTASSAQAEIVDCKTEVLLAFKTADGGKVSDSVHMGINPQE